jgi:hypothetical protein
MITIGDWRCDLANSIDEEDRELEEDEDTEQGKLRKDDESSSVLSNISIVVQHLMERFGHK